MIGVERRSGSEVVMAVARGQPMKLAVILLSMLFAGFAFAQTGDRGSATGGTSTSSASPGGAAGTSVNGTTQTNQGSAYGNNANGSQTEGTNRNPTNSVKRVANHRQPGHPNRQGEVASRL